MAIELVFDNGMIVFNVAWRWKGRFNFNLTNMEIGIDDVREEIVSSLLYI